ncbi:type I restriction enzyme HsdR N-terminal domain-containing protein [Flavobacterium selenitireducens]|uniref:type I restriction enzyme HsdR N-terminal domain-containing protein n=1 Tax=Flavobacterium selenitireducens TaxID=2722704 RepID=UPI00168A9352|nr:type I restriction enzyme HsdR N-terminal domain-containing protein [Flavobacterium selenitireducens]MBD3582988.1 type I restriction enzyme HsdR N-terminal domain-containing protein [Flavobacterium selenitireducens]
MLALNFNAYAFRFRNTQERVHIFCDTRKKFVVLTPEEWVRQHVVQYLLRDKKYPGSLVNVEKVLKVNGLSKRYDAVVFNPDGSIFLLVECKAPEVPITQNVFDQIARYNLEMKAQYLMVTNGLAHYFCKMDYDAKKYIFLKEIPAR